MCVLEGRSRGVTGRSYINIASVNNFLPEVLAKPSARAGDQDNTGDCGRTTYTYRDEKILRLGEVSQVELGWRSSEHLVIGCRLAFRESDKRKRSRGSGQARGGQKYRYSLQITAKSPKAIPKSCRYHSRGNLTNQIRILYISKYKILLIGQTQLTELLISSSIYIKTSMFKGCQYCCTKRDGFCNRSCA